MIHVIASATADAGTPFKEFTLPLPLQIKNRQASTRTHELAFLSHGFPGQAMHLLQVQTEKLPTSEQEISPRKGCQPTILR